MTGFGYLAKEGFKNVWNNRIMSFCLRTYKLSCSHRCGGTFFDEC